jgi:hypothetical protein
MQAARWRRRARALVARVARAAEEEEEEALQDRKRAAVVGPEAVAVSAVLVAFLAARVSHLSSPER